VTYETPSLSLIFLMYNEEENIGPALDEALDWCNAHLADWEIVVVDDGSTDQSAAVVREYIAREPRISMVANPQNRGMGGAMSPGIRAATKDYLIFFPADLQVPVAELDVMLPCLKSADIVLTIYNKRPSTAWRAVMSRSFRNYMFLLAEMNFLLEGLYLYPTELARQIEPLIRANTFFYSFELIKRGMERGAVACTTTISNRPRFKGTSKVANSRTIFRVVGEVVDYRVRRLAERITRG
jgi:glycosyltransferase involved in cell wall biosynthesis